MITWLLGNAVIGLGLAALAALACRLQPRRPGLCHLLWLVVVIRLVAPPTPVPGVPDLPLGPALQRAVDGAGGLVAEAARVVVPPTVDRWAKPDIGAANVESVLPGSTDWRPLHVAPAPPTAVTQTLSAALLGAWLIGSLVVFVRHLAGVLAMARRARTSSPADAALIRLVRDVAGRMDVAAPDVRVLEHLGSPAVWALGRPVLLWPRELSVGGAVHGTSARLLVAHELAHLKRRDHWVAWFEVLATTAFWWNPVLLYARRRVRRYAEMACDAWAIRVFPDHRRAYAEALIDAAQALPVAPQVAPVLGVASDEPRDFERRLTMIMRDPITRDLSPAAAAVAVLVTTLLLPSVGRATPPTNDDAPKLSAYVASDPALAPAIERAVTEQQMLVAFESQDWESALAHCDTLLASSDGPLAGKLQAKRGKALLVLGRLDEAKEAYEAQSRAGVAVPWAFLGLARVAVSQGDDRAASTAASQAVAFGLDDVEALSEVSHDAALIHTVKASRDLWALADEAIEKKAFDKAQAAYREILEHQPENGAALHMLGYCQIGAGEHAAALETFGRQLELGHRSDVAHYNSACALSLMGRTDEAWEHLSASLEQGFENWKLLAEDSDLDNLAADPRFAEVRSRIGATREAQAAATAAIEEGRVDEALAALDDLHRSAPDSGWAHSWRAESLTDLGHHAQAAEAWSHALVAGLTHEESLDALAGLARCQAQSGRDDEALSTLAAAVDAGWEGHLADESAFAPLADRAAYERVSQTLSDRAVLAEFGAKSWEGLHRQNQAAVAADPTDGKSWHRLGWASMRTGDLEAAIEAFTQQDANGFSEGNARYNLACCHALLGRSDAAFDWLSLAIETGGVDAEHMAADVDLITLRDSPRFAELVSQAAAHSEQKGGTWFDSLLGDWTSDDKAKDKQKLKDKRKEKAGYASADSSVRDV